MLACPAHDEVDRLALAMLRQLLPAAKWEVEIAAVGPLASELIAYVAQHRPGVVCIGAVPPGGLGRTCYLCKRLRMQFPALKLVVGRWGLTRGRESNRSQLWRAGVHFMAVSLLETRGQLKNLLPTAIADRHSPSPAGPPSA